MKKTRRFLCLLLTLVLALSLCAIPAAAADTQTRSDDPVVFVHGLFGWGQRDKNFQHHALLGHDHRQPAGLSGHAGL